jgi:hypothetical protein
LVKFVHPAIDYLDGKLWFGANLPKEDGVYDHHLVTSDRRVLDPYDNGQMGEYILRASPAVMYRWSEEGIRAYLEGRENGDGVYQELLQLLKEHIEFQDEREYKLVAVWIMGTYVFVVFRTYPYLSFSGLKRSGKSKVLDFLSLVAFNAINSADISDSSIYRLCEATRSTILMDEAHALESREAKQIQKNLLWAGYRKGKKVYRTDKTSKGIHPVSFEIWSPKAFVTFKGVEDILADRAIPIVMVRTNSPVADRDLKDDDPRWQRLRDRLYAWAMTNFRSVWEAYESLEPEVLHGRQRELWSPIFALASVIDPSLLQEMKELAVERCSWLNEEDQSYREMKVLEALIILTKDWEQDEGLLSHTRVKEVVHTLLEADEDKKWMNSQAVSRIMANSFGFKVTHVGRKPFRIVSKSRVLELAKRYGVDPAKVLEDEREQLRRFLRQALQKEKRWEVLAEMAREMEFKPEDVFRELDALCKGIEYRLPTVPCPEEEPERDLEGKRRCNRFHLRCGVEDHDKCPLRRREE